METSAPQMKLRRRLAVTPALLGALVLAGVLASGCGSSKKSSASTAGSTASPAAQGAPTGAGESASGAAMTVRTKQSKLGSILAAGPKRLTVYLFEADTGATSSCVAACASVWPPVQASGTIVAHGGVDITKVSRITRPDGTKQVTYNGHPLYYYARDGDRSDAYGQGLKSFGAAWYVLAPSGNKIDKS
jgi:predicted lipoprotein with Yx(FWY)xxD motif